MIIFAADQNKTDIKTRYYGHGKLLLTGEYAVLDGAKALALPTIKGQSMTIKKTRGSDLVWESLDEEGNVWFKSTISLMDFSALSTTDEEVSKRLQKILKSAVRLNSEFLSKWNGFKVETQLEFPRQWGLGSSSTLVHAVAEWAEVHPLMLCYKCSNGSGYDVACAGAEGPIVFQSDSDSVSYTPIDFSPSFSKHLFFVYLGNKQQTETQIEYYLKKGKNRKTLVKQINEITEEMMNVKSLSDFESLIEKHEQLLSQSLSYPPIQEKFPDFWGKMKSLGAWGGDFALVTSKKSQEDTEAYFQNQGLDTVIPFEEMVL